MMYSLELELRLDKDPCRLNLIICVLYARQQVSCRGINMEVWEVMEESICTETDPLRTGIIMISLLFLMLPLRLYEMHIVKCGQKDSQPSLHDYYQPGELIIGAIASQTLLLTILVTFREQPFDAFEDVM